MRWLIRLGGTLDPFGGMPRDMRLAYWRNRGRLRAAVQEMIALAPHRVILAHGRWYRNDGTAQLRRAFHWLLPGSPTAEPIPKPRSEEHTSELQSLMRISYAVFCLTKKNTNKNNNY